LLRPPNPEQPLEKLLVSPRNLLPVLDSLCQDLGARKIQKNSCKREWHLGYFEPYFR
jgi:hypothetical protein